MDIKDFKAKLYEEFKTAIDAISIANDKDVGVALDMFLSNMEMGGTYPYVNEELAKTRIAELTAQMACDQLPCEETEKVNDEQVEEGPVENEATE